MTPTKPILSLRVARALIDAGHVVVGIEHSRAVPGKLAFIFERSAKFDADCSRILTRRQ